MNYRMMEEKDFPDVVKLYIDYYNTQENGEWTELTARKRIHQVFSREDSFCMVLEEAGIILAFAMGYFEQYDDCSAYDLIEIVVAGGYQKQGIGTAFMKELEKRVKEAGAMLIQLESVNDSAHERFYGRLGYQTASNLVLKSKII